MKRVVSLLMVGVLLVSVVLIMGSALTSNGFTYEVVDNEAIITAYNNTTTDIVIPNSLGNVPVTAIGEFAFANRSENKGGDMRSLTLPDSIKRIGNGAFCVNSTITSLRLPAALEEIGDRAFHGWIKLTSVEFSGNHLTHIGKWAFRNCHSLASVAFPKSLKTIDVAAFSYCVSLTGVELPESVLEIGREAFLACTSLSEVTILNDNMGIGDNAFDLTALSSSDDTKRMLNITGYENSSAQRFATAESFSFTKLDKPEEPDNPEEPIQTNGDYYVKITFTITDANNFLEAYGGYNKKVNDSAGISLLYKGVNGTADSYQEYKWDIKNIMTNGGTGTYTLSAYVDGFPYLLYGYLDDNFAFGVTGFNINKLEVGSSAADLKQVWTGKICLSSKTNGYGVSLDWNNTEKRDYFGTDSNNKVDGSSGKWEKPFAKTMLAEYERQEIQLSREGEETENTFSYNALDQYNVKLNHTLCSIASAADIAGQSKYVATSYNAGSGVTSVQKAIHLLEEGKNTQQINTSFVWKCKDKTNTANATFTVYDEQYDIIFRAPDGSLLDEQIVYYGDTPSFELPQKENDDTYHYSAGHWQPEPAAADKDIMYQAEYEAQEHHFMVDKTQSFPAGCELAGKKVSVCLDCAYTKTEVIPAKGHSYTSFKITPDCTQRGCMHYVCSHCGDSYEDSFVPALGHDFSLERKNAQALRTPATETENATYYYTCSRCGDIGKSENLFFEALCASFSGKIDMKYQFKPVLVSLYQAGEEYQSVEIIPDSSGEFTFVGLEPAVYTVVIRGDSTTVSEFETLDLSTGEKINLSTAEAQEVKLIALSNGDINSDGSVDISDISLLLSEELYGVESVAGRSEDINNDGVINIADVSVALLAGNYAGTSRVLSL